ncbi:MAG TPA: cobyric acid synthase [Dehalococcoidia bacterium]
MTAKVLMVQGTASSVGKSVLVAALCRVFADEGVRVAPFKAQNMSNNSYVTPDGLEIGRAQAEQARAARLAPDVRMNPVLLKPEGDLRSQVVLMGRPAGSLSTQRFSHKRRLWSRVRAALDSLREEYELVIMEGAGSPAEINLRRADITNMRVARYAQAPVLLVGDIDNGGVFAHLVGTLALLTPAERRLVRGFIINKFRGDVTLLEPGLELLQRRTGRPVLGVLPYLHDLEVAEEDAVALDRRRRDDQTAAPGAKIAVVRLPHISNFDDFDPLASSPGVSLAYVRRAEELGDADLVILPGTKNTRADLRWLQESGLAQAIRRLRGAGCSVIGICGGFQMLGKRVLDPLGIEGPAGSEQGLGLLPVRTTFLRSKATRRVTARVLGDIGLLAGLRDVSVEGYEIHMGQTEAESSRPAILIQDEGEDRARPDGAVSEDGRVFGTYLHGLFANDLFRRRLLANLPKGLASPEPDSTVWDPEVGLDRLARQARAHLDIEAIRRIAGL